MQFSRNNLFVGTAGGQQVIGVGRVSAIALTISNKGNADLNGLSLKYSGANNTTWWDYLVEEGNFSSIRVEGSDPFRLEAGKSTTLYLDVSQANSLCLEARVAGDTSTFPEPSTHLDISVTETTLGHSGLPKENMDDLVQVMNSTGYIQAGSTSYSFANIGEDTAYVFFRNSDNTWRIREIPPDGTPIAYSGGRRPEIRFDATKTTLKVTATGAMIVQGEFKTPLIISLGTVSPKNVSLGGTIELTWNLAPWGEGTYEIAIYPPSSTLFSEVTDATLEPTLKFSVAPGDPLQGIKKIPLVPVEIVPKGSYKFAVYKPGVDGTLFAEVPFTVN